MSYVFDSDEQRNFDLVMAAIAQGVVNVDAAGYATIAKDSRTHRAWCELCELVQAGKVGVITPQSAIAFAALLAQLRAAAGHAAEMSPLAVDGLLSDAAETIALLGRENYRLRRKGEVVV